jgi:membrane-bound inhibitor of C-type lysozyme
VPRTPVLLSLIMLTACASSQAADPDTIGPVTFTCDDGSEILATFDNAPDPGTVLLVRGEQQFTLPHVLSGSGARYLGDGIEFWSKGRDAMVDWRGQKFSCSEAD